MSTLGRAFLASLANLPWPTGASAPVEEPEPPPLVAPNAVNDVAGPFDEDSNGGFVDINVLLNDTYSGTPTISIVGQTGPGTATVTGTGASSRIRIRTDAGFGTKTVTYSLSATNNEGSDQATLSAEIEEVVEPPEDPTLLEAITSRSPEYYVPLNADSLANEGSASLTTTVTGTPSAKTVEGWTLGDGVYLQVNHSTVFETDTGTRFAYVDSEVTVTLEVVIPSLASQVNLCSKGNGNSSRFGNAWWLEAMTDGSLRLIVEDSQDRHEVRTQTGVLVAGQRHRLAIQFGRMGLRLWVDAKHSNWGWPLLEHWYGWDHRVRGGSQETVCLGERWVNNHPFRIGHNGFGADGTVTVRHVAIFVSGGTNLNPFTRAGAALTQLDIEAIAGTGSVSTTLKDFTRSGGSTVHITTAQDLKTRLATASSGDIVTLAAGTHTFTGNLVIPSGVRIVGLGAGRGGTVINGSSDSNAAIIGSSAGWLNLTSRDTSGNTWSKGAHSITLSDASGIVEDDILIIISSVEHEFDWYGTTGDFVERKRSDLVAVLTVSGNTVNLKNSLMNSYTSGQRIGVWRLRPSVKNTILENLTMRTKATINATSLSTARQTLLLDGAAALRMRNIAVFQDATTDDQVCTNIRGCVNVDLQNSHFESFADSTNVGSFHPYVFNVGAGRSTRAKGCWFETKWADGLDTGFNNIGSDIGGGPTQHIACSWVEQIDCHIEAGHFSVGIGGHSRVARRIFACTTNKGITCSRDSYLDETWGVTMGMAQSNIAGGSKSFHSWVKAPNSSHTGMYRQFGGERQKDTVFHEFRWASPRSIQQDGTVSNLFFRNCDTPHPTGTTL